MADKYANSAWVAVTPTLNTLSFAELATFVSVFEKKAFLLNRINYYVDPATLQELDAETDSINFGLSTSDNITTVGLNQAAVIDYTGLVVQLTAAGVSSHLIQNPFTNDLSTLPGGGVLVPCRPIFLWTVSAGLAAAGYVQARIYFTVVDLKAEEYWELVESTRMIGA